MSTQWRKCAFQFTGQEKLLCYNSYRKNKSHVCNCGKCVVVCMKTCCVDIVISSLALTLSSGPRCCSSVTSPWANKALRVYLNWFMAALMIEWWKAKGSYRSGALMRQLILCCCMNGSALFLFHPAGWWQLVCVEEICLRSSKDRKLNN